MNTDTGEIFAKLEQAQKSALGHPEKIRMIPWSSLTARQRSILATGKNVKIGRNAPCPCGSGMKFKRCCYSGPRNHA